MRPQRKSWLNTWAKSGFNASGSRRCCLIRDSLQGLGITCVVRCCSLRNSTPTERFLRSMKMKKQGLPNRHCSFHVNPSKFQGLPLIWNSTSNWGILACHGDKHGTGCSHATTGRAISVENWFCIAGQVDGGLIIVRCVKAETYTKNNQINKSKTLCTVCPRPIWTIQFKGKVWFRRGYAGVWGEFLSIPISARQLPCSGVQKLFCLKMVLWQNTIENLFWNLMQMSSGM